MSAGLRVCKARGMVVWRAQISPHTPPVEFRPGFSAKVLDHFLTRKNLFGAFGARFHGLINCPG